LKILHGDPNLPGALDVPELSFLGTASLFGLTFGGTANISQVTDGEGKTMFTPEGEINMKEDGLRVCSLIPSFAGMNDSFYIGYASLNNTYDFDIYGINEGNYTFYFMPTDNLLAGFTSDTFSGSSDIINIDSKNLYSNFLTHDSKKFGYKIIKEFNESGRTFLLSNIETNGNGNVAFIADENGNNVTIINNGDETSYDIKTERVGKEKQKFEYKDIHLRKKEKHLISPTSWDSLSKGKLRIDIDKNNDGVWDEHKLLIHVKKKTQDLESSLPLHRLH